MQPEKFDLKDILNADFLSRYDLKLILAEESSRFPIRTFQLVSALAPQIEGAIKHQLKFLKQILPHISDRTYRKWITNNYDISLLYPAYFKRFIDRYESIRHQSFEIIVTYNLDEMIIIETTLHEIGALCPHLVTEKASIDVIEVMENRRKSIEIIAEQVQLTKDGGKMKTYEDTVLKVCMFFAEGLVSITQACDHFKISYLSFVEMLNRSDYCRQTYDQACRLAASLQTSQQLNHLDTRLAEILMRGTHTETAITHNRVQIPGQLEAKWIPVKKIDKTRDLTISEIAALKSMLIRSQTSLIDSGQDQFSRMSEAELLDFVMKEQQKYSSQ